LQPEKLFFNPYILSPLTLYELYNLYAKHPQIKAINQLIADRKNNISITGVQASAEALVCASVYEKSKKPLLFIANDQESAAYLYNDLAQILGQDEVLFFPSAYKKAFKYGTVDSANEILRTEVLNRLSQIQNADNTDSRRLNTDKNIRENLRNQRSILVVSYPEAVAEKVITSTSLREKILTLTVGESVDTEFVIEVLINAGFERVDFVYEPGQFSNRGSIIDIFSFSNELPYRVDFFGNEVETIRLFDIETQLSTESRQTVAIVPDIHTVKKTDQTISFLQFITDDTLLAFNDYLFIKDKINQLYDDSLIAANESGKKADLKDRLITGDDFLEEISAHQKITFNNRVASRTSATVPGTSRSSAAMRDTEALEVSVIEFRTSPQPLYHKNFDLVVSSFKEFLKNGYKLYILSDSTKQTDRIQAIFEDKGEDISFTPVLRTLHEGFIDHDLSLCFFSDHQLFDRFHKYTLRSDKARSGKVLLTLKELNQFQVGDYVTHIDHGVGRFGGLFKQEINGKKQEVIKLVYKDDDIIFVSIHNLHRISKYKGREGEPPKINKLGTGAWERLKERTKSKVKDIARDLIKLYARRKAEQGFAFSPDTYLQQELEASFIYEDTPDQLKATADVKQDMEKLLPMDRLVCGDVGFGKTEVAMRAAFKAATDGKQVAVLVPTTVLALQHYKSFKERLKDFPCRVDYLSRARKASDVKAIKQDLADGKIDIIIGTHKLVGKDIKFKDLGLLIIDEEQKFGVSVKEKLKALKVNVDTLTMTATPIPRTLQFSLLGARDLSIINTPPPNRYPIQTEVYPFDAEVIREAVEREMSRNGQVFIINNRIQNIYELEAIVKKAVPEARIVVGHGQMNPEKLEEIIVDFIDYEYDVLIATTIIESGIDIPNANTIIINNAHQFGLSDLHQLRGRVGRSNRKAYCYLLAPPMSMLTPEARRRLQAIETFTDLGSGFHIAMQDLDIRGAGNMLGAEQSGFIADLGYETYQKILNEAVHELKDEEFAELYADEKKESGTSAYVLDCQIESDLELMFPTDYIENISERMTLYRELDNIDNETDLQAFAKRLDDRFGKLPKEAEQLLTAIRLRWLAMQLGFEKIVLKNERMIGYLVSNLKSGYYQTEAFGKVLNYMANNPRDCQLKEQNARRFVSIKNMKNIEQAYDILINMNNK
jgi:transcription-repair coupling factor (superfamily II helicase)